MKTALESYFETITIQEKKKLLQEQEIQELTNYDPDPFLSVIQKDMESAISHGKFNCTLKFIQRCRPTNHNGYMDLWFLAQPESTWDYNKTCHAYYQIRYYCNPMLTIQPIVDALEKMGYTCEITPLKLREASSKTGKCFGETSCKELKISWHNNIKILGELHE